MPVWFSQEKLAKILFGHGARGLYGFICKNTESVHLFRDIRVQSTAVSVLEKAMATLVPAPEAQAQACRECEMAGFTEILEFFHLPGSVPGEHTKNMEKTLYTSLYSQW